MPAKKRPSSSISSASAGGPQTSNFRPFVEKGRWASKGTGTKPLPDPTTVPQVLTKVIIHGCRKILFVDPKIRLMAYTVLLFFFSLVSDYLPFPKTYFAYSGNIPNTYFVKFSWGWTFVFSGIFMYLTSAVYCCGERKLIARHMGRLFVGTLVWFIWTYIFRIIEESTGQCLLKDGTSLYSIKNRRACIAKSGKWTSFDISGHSFLLIWCVFVITEEARAIIGWDGIKDLIRNEEHFRGKITQVGPGGELAPETSLNALSESEFEQLKVNYSQFDIPVKLILIGMTVLVLLWDLMILMTAIYFHVMIEKVIGGLAAVLTWLFVYRCFYKYTKTSPGLPGQGLFRYNFESRSSSFVTKSTVSNPLSTKIKGTTTSPGTRPRIKESDDIPKFMGMPLNPLTLKTLKKEDNLDNSLRTENSM